MNHSIHTHHDIDSGEHHEQNHLIALLKNLEPGSAIVMVLALAMLVYLLWVFFGSYIQTY